MKLVHDPAHDRAMTEACADGLAAMARDASIELTPRQIAAVDELRQWLAEGTRVYVPYLPNADYQDVILACQRLLDAGLVAVPHFPARAMTSQQQARDHLDALAAHGVRELMLIAGDTARPAGPYVDSLALLESGLLQRHRFGLGIAGHPEGHPAADSSALKAALSTKREYALATDTPMWVVTQFAFEAGSFLDWLHDHGDVIAPLPVHFGIAGPTRLRTLMAYAAQCGVGASARALMRHPETTRLLRSWTPDGLVHALACYRLEHPLSLFHGLHIFPFGGLKRSAKWLEGLVAAGQPERAPHLSGGLQPCP